MARIDLKQNEYLEKLVSQEHVDSNDNQFWYGLLTCSFNFMKVQDPRVVDKTLEPYIVRLTLSNSTSLNIGSLLRAFLSRVSQVKSSSGQSTNPYYIYQSFNALYLIRSICKSYIESSGEEQLIKSFRAKIDEMQAPVPPAQQPVAPVQHQQPINQAGTNDQPSTGVQYAENTAATVNSDSTILNPQPVDQLRTSVVSKKGEFTSGSSMLDQLISTLIAILVDIPLDDSTYLLQVEAINTLLVLLSVQMYSSTPAKQSTIYKQIMSGKSSIHALILTKTLLCNFIRQLPLPQESGSIIIGIASGLWRVLTLGYGSMLDEEDAETMPLLAKQSLLLLNVLTNHNTTEKNPYREAIISCQDSGYNLTDPVTAFENATNDLVATATVSKSVVMSNSIKVDFEDLHSTICKYLHNDQVALLLYLLLHSNRIFRPYILTSAAQNLDNLVLPLLKILYTSMDRGSHHVYMVLILFIILSEEASFNKTIHNISLKGVAWYKDRTLGDISLGSLTALIIIRAFQYNTFKVRDSFLHTNLFATLANLSNHFQNLHIYVCQRLIELLEKLSKRYLVLTKTKSPADTLQPVQTAEILRRDNSLAKALATDTVKQQDLRDASSIELDSTFPTNNPLSSVNHSAGINVDLQNIQTSNTENGLQHENDFLPQNPNNQDLYDVQHPASGSSSASDHINISIDDTKQDVGLIEEVIRMILEVLNNTLASQLVNNTDLIYTLLYKRSVFSSLLSSHQSFYNMALNVERILTFFYEAIESYDRSLSVEEIKALIQTSSQGWMSKEIVDQNAKLLFHYVEDEQPEEFFIPYIWTRIYYSSGIPWNSKRIVLFNPDDV